MNSNAPRAESLRARDARVIANIGRLRFSPLSLVGGCGNHLIEEGGRRLLDLSASFGPAALGYSHPAITASGESGVREHGGREPARLPERAGGGARGGSVAAHARTR